MPTTKLASFRYRVIDKCLRNKYQKYTYERLMKVIEDELYEQFGKEDGISRRTFFTDIEIMKSAPERGYNAPIVFKNGVYSYTDPDFSILNSPFNQEDLLNIQEAVAILTQFKGLPNLSSINGMIGKLKAEMLSYNLDMTPVLLLDTNPEYTGYKWIESLYIAIKDEKSIKVIYKPFHKMEASEFTFHPYLIKEYNNRWFVLGWHSKEKLIHNLPLDRIQSIKKSKEPYLKDGKARIVDYFDHIIGVSLPRGATVEKIQLQIADSLYPYFETKPLHKSQKVLKVNKNTVIIELNLIVNTELETTLLKYIDRIKIIEPVSLRKKIQSLLNQAIHLNSD